MDIINTTLIITALVNVFLASAVYFHRKSENKINRIFSIVVLDIVLWSFTMIYFRHTDDITNLLFFSRLLYAIPLFMPVTFLHFAVLFVRNLVSIPRKAILFIIYPFTIAFAAVTLFTSYIVTGVEIPPEGEKIVSFANTYWLYIIHYFLFFGVAFFYLLRAFAATTNDILRHRILILLVGVFIPAAIGMVGNLILPWFGIYFLNWLANFITILYVGFMFYAIVRYQLFDLKIIATEIFVIFILALLLFEIFLAGSPIELLIKMTILILVASISYLLIKSVIREVEQREELAIANKGQENLIHIMNHQIKGYLGKNKGIFAELLSGDHGSFNGTAKKYVEEGLRQSTEGVEYVQTILKGASASKGQLEYDMKPVDISELVSEVADDQKSSAEKNNLHFETNIADEDFNTKGDASQLKEAFRNLIENAINYSDAGGDIEVSLHKEGGNIVFEVKDTGKGIPKEVKPRLFTPGGRSKDATEYNPNTSGFGLAFVKGVVEAHHGRVDYKPNPDGKGTVFFIEFPAKSYRHNL